MRLFRSSEPSQEELQQQQAQNALHQTNLGSMQQGEHTPDKEFLREITEEQLDEGTYELMQNLFSHDFILSNLNAAQEQEIRWLAQVVARKIKRMHPDPECYAVGERRRIVFDDPDGEALRPLSPQQESLIDQATLQFLTRPARSREGWQQEELSKSYTYSEVGDSNDGQSGRSLFGEGK